MPFHLRVFVVMTAGIQPTLRLSCTYTDRCHKHAEGGHSQHGLHGFSLATFQSRRGRFDHNYDEIMADGGGPIFRKQRKCCRPSLPHSHGSKARFLLKTAFTPSSVSKMVVVYTERPIYVYGSDGDGADDDPRSIDICW